MRHWAAAKLSEITTKVGSGATPLGGEKVYQSSGIPLIRSMNVHFDGFRNDGLVYLDAKQARQLDGVIVEAEDVLLNITGASIGRVTVAPANLAGARVNQHVCILRPNSAVEPRFLSYLLATPAMQEEILDEESGATRQALTKAKILDFDIPIPPLAEQRRIVAKVEELTARSRAARAALAEVPTLLEQFRQSVLASAFRGDLTADWRAKNPTAEPASVLLDRIRAERRKHWETKYPKKKYAAPEPVDDSELPELPEGWCWASVDELAEVQLGQRRAPEYIGKAEYAYIRSANITWEGLDLTDVKRMGFDDADPLLLRRGDILLNEASGSPTEVGKPALWNDEIPACCLQATVLRLRGNSTEVSPLWLFYHSLRDALLAEYAAKCPGLGIIHLTAKLLRKWPVPLAPLAEQTEIIRRLDLAEQQRRSTASAVSVALQDNDALDQSILAKAFRGELVPQDPAEEPATALLARIKAGVDEATLGLLGFAVAGTTHLSQWSRTKSQKFGYLAVTHLGYPAELEFGPGKAGPYADELRRAEEFAAQRGYFTVSTEPKDDPSLSAATRFTPGPHRQAGRDLGQQHFGTRADDGERLLEQIVAMTTPDAELFGTVYAVWSNLLAATGTADDAAIVAGVHAWHEEKAKKFPAEVIHERLAWMRENGYIPTDGGKPTAPGAKPKPPRKRKA